MLHKPPRFPCSCSIYYQELGIPTRPQDIFGSDREVSFIISIAVIVVVVVAAGLWQDGTAMLGFETLRRREPLLLLCRAAKPYTKQPVLSGSVHFPYTKSTCAYDLLNWP